MGRSEDLSDFQRGTIIGCHLSKKSVREISALLEMPRSTVSNVIMEWKRLGITTPLPRSGRPQKHSDKDNKVLERVASENGLSSVMALTTEVPTSSGKNVSPRTVHQEVHSLGFPGQTAANHAKVIKSSAKPVLKPPSKETRKTKEHTVSSNEGNPSVCEEDQGHMDAQTTAEPAAQSVEGELSTLSHSTEAQSRDLKQFEAFSFSDLNFTSDATFGCLN